MQQFPNKFKILFGGYKISPVSITVRKDPASIPLADALVLGLEKIKADGTYDALLKKWALTAVDSFGYNR
jgi:ABC-type amino acid transport substrate-binding protein